uniref:Uncharacterized protein n=1 Tax=Glossina brevipalpis TaxID=37001 RepID=A0A1A9W3S6_9MUSC
MPKTARQQKKNWFVKGVVPHFVVLFKYFFVSGLPLQRYVHQNVGDFYVNGMKVIVARSRAAVVAAKQKTDNIKLPSIIINVSVNARLASWQASRPAGQLSS